MEITLLNAVEPTGFGVMQDLMGFLWVVERLSFDS